MVVCCIVAPGAALYYAVKLYQHDVGSTDRVVVTDFVTTTFLLSNLLSPLAPEQKPDLIQSQIRFSFLYREKVGIISGNGGNSSFCFLYSSVYGDNAAAGNDRGDGMENPTLGKIKIRISQYNRNQLK